MDEPTEARLVLEAKITNINSNIKYFSEQVNMAWIELQHFKELGNAEDIAEADKAYREHLTNLNSERKVKSFMEARLESGNYSLETQSSLGSKRKAS